MMSLSARGGGERVVPLDAKRAEAERAYALDLGFERSPDREVGTTLFVAASFPQSNISKFEARKDQRIAAVLSDLEAGFVQAEPKSKATIDRD